MKFLLWVSLSCCIYNITTPKVIQVFSCTVFQKFHSFVFCIQVCESPGVNFSCPVVPAPFVEKTTFAPLYCLCFFVKDQLTAFTCVLSHFSLVQFFMTRILEWVTMPSSGGIFLPRDQTRISRVSCIGTQVLYRWCHLGSPGCFYVALFPSSLFCPTDLSIIFCQYYTVLIAAALQEGLKLDALSPSSLFFSLNIMLVILSFTSPGKNQLVDWWDIVF